MKSSFALRICSAVILVVGPAAISPAEISLTGGKFTETFTTLPPASS